MGKCFDNKDVKINAAIRVTRRSACGSRLGWQRRPQALAMARMREDASPTALTRHPALAWFDNMIPNCLRLRHGRQGQGQAHRRHPVRVHAAGADHGGRGGAGLPLRRLGRDDRGRPRSTCRPTSARSSNRPTATTSSKANPFLEMADLIVAETTCDGKKKMYELMAETPADARAGAAAEAGRRRRDGPLDQRAAQAQGPARRDVPRHDHRREDPPGDRRR